MNINFTYYLGDNELEVSATIHTDGEIEIDDVWLVTEKGHAPFKCDGIYEREFGMPEDGKTFFKSLYGNLEYAAMDARSVA